jgi:hypothetical protein
MAIVVWRIGVMTEDLWDQLADLFDGTRKEE